MTCPSCGRALPPSFPGGTVQCACGRRVSLDAVAPAAAPATGPYRAAAALVGEEARTASCPFCGNECPPLVRICPHCDVRLENVRCARCFSLQAPGSFACARCGQGLELEPLLDATDAPCPRCASPLEVAAGDDRRVHECPRCGGMFVPRDALAEILSLAELGGTIAGAARGATMLEEVRYLACPLCHTSMNRVNFGRASGVIVDVCRGHGTWFDAGELTRVVAFAASGGLEKTRERELRDKHDARASAARVHASLVALETSQRIRARADEWSELLSALLFW